MNSVAPSLDGEDQKPARVVDDENVPDELLFRILTRRYGAEKVAHIQTLLDMDSGAPTDGNDSEDTRALQKAAVSPAPSLLDDLSDWEQDVFADLVHEVDSTATLATSEAQARSPLHCHICLKDACTAPVAAPCGHIFCHACIGRELTVRTECPVCRRTILQSLILG